MSIIYYQSRDAIHDRPRYFGYLLNGAGWHYVASGHHMRVMPIGDRDIMPFMGEYCEQIDRPAFDRLLARWAPPPALD